MATQGQTGQPFSAPAFAPWTKKRWNTRNMIATGMVMSSAAGAVLAVTDVPGITLV